MSKASQNARTVRCSLSERSKLCLSLVQSAHLAQHLPTFEPVSSIVRMLFYGGLQCTQGGCLITDASQDLELQVEKTAMARLDNEASSDDLFGFSRSTQVIEELGNVGDDVRVVRQDPGRCFERR